MTDLSRVAFEPSSGLPADRCARIGIDLVRVDAIERSVADFGARFTGRLFADGELRDSLVAGRLDARALAQRFAAKEAAIKAFDLAEAGVAWSQIEVVDVVGQPGCTGRIALRGRAAEAAARGGTYDIAVSLSQDGDLACAIVVALPVGGGAARAPGEHAAERATRQAA